MYNLSVVLPGPDSVHNRSYDTLEVVRLDDRAFTYLYSEGQQRRGCSVCAAWFLSVEFYAVACNGFNMEMVLFCLLPMLKGCPCLMTIVDTNGLAD